MAGLSGILRRGFLGIFRSPIRTLMLVGLLAISIGLAGSMLAVNGAVGQRIDEVAAEVRPQLILRPAGSFGFFGGGEPMNEAGIAQVGDLAHVVSVERTVQGQYSGTALVSGIQAGSLGRRFRGGGGGALGGNFSIPIIVTGIEPGTQATLLGGGVAEVVAGRPLAPEDADAGVALLGQALADANSLSVGSSIDWEGTPVEVIGLFQTGNRFGNNIIVMPLHTAQRLLGLEGEVSQAMVNLDSADNISPVAQAITTALGSDKVDVISDTQRITNVTNSLQGAQRTTSIGMFVGLGAGAAVVLVAMVLVVRERRREIGMFKVIGASNRQVVLQFAAENLAIAVLAVALGLLVAQITIEPVTAQTLPDTQPRLVNVGGGQGFAGFGGGGGGQFAFRGTAGLGGSSLLGLGNINAGLTAGSALLTAGSGLAVVVLTTLATAWSIARIRPAEVLRSEG